MEPFTLDRTFHKKHIIDSFNSIIWTERYYGDSEVELVVPATNEMFEKLPLGIFLGIDKSDEIMILETGLIEENKLKLTGISLLKWLNNRFVRNTNLHAEKAWTIETQPGTVLWSIVYYNCVAGSPFLSGSVTGIPNPQQLAIPGLGLISYDTFGDPVKFAIPYGPVYDAMREIATTYQIGMQLLLGDVTDTSYFLGFRSYRGLDRTSAQTVNSIVRFSPTIDSLSNVKELQSIALQKTQAYVFAPGGPVGHTGPPGVSVLAGPEYTGFDLRAIQVLADDIVASTVGGDVALLKSVLDTRAAKELAANSIVETVDGEIGPVSQFKYGIDYHLGDIIETQGNTGIVSISRVTEYIRTQDESGEKSYPTVEAL